jgi:hypothetical protein
MTKRPCVAPDAKTLSPSFSVYTGGVLYDHPTPLYYQNIRDSSGNQFYSEFWKGREPNASLRCVNPAADNKHGLRGEFRLTTAEIESVWQETDVTRAVCGAQSPLESQIAHYLDWARGMANRVVGNPVQIPGHTTITYLGDDPSPLAPICKQKARELAHPPSPKKQDRLPLER